MMYQIDIEPRDVLFFKDAKPLGGSSVGNGAVWPLPNTLHAALMSALYAKWPDLNSSFETKHNTMRAKHDKNYATSQMRFGGLKTAGPFPMLSENIYLPAPADICAEEMNEVDDDGKVNLKYQLMSPALMPGNSNLPSPLIYPVASFTPPSKASLGEWISCEDYTSYLQGDLGQISLKKSSEFFDSEPRPGVAINPETHSNEDGKFYQASYIRLKEQSNGKMTAFVECQDKKTASDLIHELFESSSKIPFVFGGQRGLAYLSNKREKTKPCCPFVSISGTRVKWVLLSPAVFSHGYLPGWLVPSGNSSGRLGDVLMCPEINGVKTSIKAKLVAARINKPFHFSGWKLDKDKDNAGGAPKSTYMVVPAGSVYYFEAESENDARNLVEALQGRRRSDFFGSQGFGLGVCGTWTLDETYKKLISENNKLI